jgi:hypothetical protein
MCAKFSKSLRCPCHLDDSPTNQKSQGTSLQGQIHQDVLQLVCYLQRYPIEKCWSAWTQAMTHWASPWQFLSHRSLYAIDQPSTVPRFANGIRTTWSNSICIISRSRIRSKRSSERIAQWIRPRIISIMLTILAWSSSGDRGVNWPDCRALNASRAFLPI